MDSNKQETLQIFRKLLLELAGQTSLCWTPRPTGVFDSELAIKAVDGTMIHVELLYDLIHSHGAAGREVDLGT